MFAQTQEKIIKKIFLFFLTFIIIYSSTYLSDFTSALSWIKKKGIVTKKFSEKEFELLQPYLLDLLREDISKEDLYAILGYFSQEGLEVEDELILFREMASLFKKRSISSKKLRNFIYKKVKIGKIKGKSNKELVLFLKREIQSLKP